MAHTTGLLGGLGGVVAGNQHVAAPAPIRAVSIPALRSAERYLTHAAPGLVAPSGPTSPRTYTYTAPDGRTYANLNLFASVARQPLTVVVKGQPTGATSGITDALLRAARADFLITRVLGNAQTPIAVHQALAQATTPTGQLSARALRPTEPLLLAQPQPRLALPSPKTADYILIGQGGVVIPLALQPRVTHGQGPGAATITYTADQSCDTGDRKSVV